MWALNLAQFLVGAAIVVIAIVLAVRTLVVPRALQAPLAHVVFLVMRRLFRLRANDRHDYRTRDGVMAFYAPVSLLAVVVRPLPGRRLHFPSAPPPARRVGGRR